MECKTVYNDINCTFDVFENGDYRLTFFKECHWHGDITFSKDGKVIFNDLSDDIIINNDFSNELNNEMNKK